MSSDIVGKSITLVELDLDAYRITQFEAAKVGQPVAYWTLRTGSDTTFVGYANAALPSGRGGRLAKTVGDATTVWGWQRPPDLANVSTIALLRSIAGTIDMRVVARHGAGTTFYALRLDGTDADIIKGESVLESTPFAVISGENVWVRFDALDIAGPGVLLRAKMWRGALGDEPSTFMVSFEDSSSPITAAGAVGLGTFTNGADYACGMFRVRAVLGEVETHRHAAPTNYLPREFDAVPDITSVSLNPGAISLGGDLGKRSSLTIGFREHPHADLGELFGNGHHWARMRARGLLRRGQPVRVRRGLLGQDLGAFETRHYVLESFDGPTPDGAFSILAQDVLKLADNDRAQAPRLNNGFLTAAIDADDVAATLGPTGIGNLEYAASGFVAIGGEEICGFTRVGDALTLTSRGQFGTPAAAHDAEDRVQTCLVFTAQTPAAIVNALLTQYADVDPSYIPLAAWETECATFLQRLYTRVIAEPVGVSRLVGELCEQAGLVIWPDDIANLIRLQVLRGVPTTAYLYGQDNTLAGSIRTQEQPSTRLSQVWTYYGVRNPLEPLDAPDNYRSSLATVDLENETLNGSAAIKKIFGTWIPAFARSNAQRVNDLQLGRFSTPPRKVSFSVMRYSGVMEPERGGGYRLQYHGSQDELGNVVAIPVQVTRAVPSADSIAVEAEEMLFKQFDPADLQDRVIPIDSNVNNINLRSLHDSIYPPITADDISNGVTVTFVVGASVIVGSINTAMPSCHVGDWPVGFTPLLQLNGRIQGKGGDGATFDFPLPNGQSGGVALYTRHDLDIEYGPSAELWGGGGGGGVTATFDDAWGGGGGAGQIPGSGGAGEGDLIPGPPGTTEAGGDTVAPSGQSDGGGPGLPGQSGTTPIGTSTGGAAGAAIDGVSFVTVVSGAGDVRGPTIN